MKLKKITVWQIITAILAIAFIASVIFFRVSGVTGAAVVNEKSITILSDERCKECDTANLEKNLLTVFPNYKIVNVDYNTKEGKQLYEKEGIKYLPAVLFDASVKSDASYSKIQTYIDETENYLSLKIGSEFDPAAEICDNGKDDTGDGLVDCDDLTCKNNLLCREETPKKLDLFVMSQCPYGTRALDSMEEVLNAFGKDVNFNLWYIANENPDGTFSSLHGQTEVDEDIREVCAAKHYPEKYMEYIWCRNKDITNAEWKACADSNGMSSAVIETCWKGDEGKKLLSENIKFANELNIGASPTWFANNRVQFSGLDAETIKQNFCKANSGLAGCGKTLNSSTEVSGNC